MITKESLKKSAQNVNQTVLKLRQSYSKSPDSKTIYMFVEGKDDICYYSSVMTNRLKPNWGFKMIAAGNREKVVDAYYKMD